MNAMLMRFLLALALLGILAVPAVHASPMPLDLTPEELAWIRANPLLRVGVFDDTAPFEYMKDGQLRGLSAKYLNMITQRTGLHFKPVITTTFLARKEMLVNGEVDMLPTRRKSDDPAMDRGIVHTQPYNTSSTILVSRVGNQPFSGLGQLAGMRIVMLGREAYADFLSKNAPGASIVTGKNALEMLTMVKDGRVDAAIASEGLLIPYLSRQYGGVLQISGVVPELHTGVSMAVRDSDVILYSILQKVLASITPVERAAVYDAWFAEMDLDIPSIQTIAEHYEMELWLLLAVAFLLLALFWQRRVQHRRAVQAEREKAMFLAIMSHEIRSPMNAVLAAVELLEHTPLDEQQRHFAGLANSGANTLLRLVDDVLDISKMEAGQLKLILEPVDLSALVQRLVEEQRPYAEEKGLSLTVSGELLNLPMLLDDRRLAQVLRNLLDNAIKFTDVGRVDVQLQLLARAVDGVAYVLIRIVDSGVGMTEQVRSSLFRPYAHSKHSYKRAGGTGLGLLICRRLLQLMHGELTLDSLTGAGTQAEVRLPVRWAPQVPSGQGMMIIAEPEEFSVPGNGLQVLVVEDVEVHRQVLQAQLHGFGCKVLLATDGAQGLALFCAYRVDMVLIDYDLLDGDGYSLAGEFRELEQQPGTHCPIIMISRVTGNEHLERCFDAGIDGVLDKPVQLAKLQQMIELWCNMTLEPKEPLLTPQTQISEELRANLNGLIEALALRERSLALSALQRLHGTALVADRSDIVLASQALDQLLRSEMNWPAMDIASHLGVLLETCGATLCTPQTG